MKTIQIEAEPDSLGFPAQDDQWIRLTNPETHELIRLTIEQARELIADLVEDWTR